MDFNKKCEDYVRCKTRDAAKVIVNKQIRYGTKNKLSSTRPSNPSDLNSG